LTVYVKTLLVSKICIFNEMDNVRLRCGSQR